MIDSRQTSDHLERCLAALVRTLACHVEPTQLLVLARDVQELRTIALRYGAQMAIGYPLTQGARRHRGVRLTQGKIVVFLDDSFIATEKWWLAVHQAFIQQRADAVILTQHAHLRLSGLSRRWRRFLYTRATRPGQGNPEGNLAIRRECFERLGGHDMNLDDTADTDFALRLVQCRVRLVLISAHGMRN
ncbi:glycosyltransferase family protein [Halomonas sp. WWR20]